MRLLGRRSRRSGEQGQMLVLFAVMFSIMLLMGSFAVDQGLWLAKRREAQKDADAAARAGAMAFLTDAADVANAEAFALENAQSNLASVTDPDTVFVADDGTGDLCIDFEDVVMPGVPSVRAQINNPSGSLFARFLGIGIDDLGANATACVGRPGELQGAEPYYVAPGGINDSCFDSQGRPNIGVQCVFKLNSQGQEGGSRGNLSLSDVATACTQNAKKDLQEQIEGGGDSVCAVGEWVEVAQGNNTSANVDGLVCRLLDQGSQCDERGEGYCDAEFNDANGSIPPFTSNLTQALNVTGHEIDDFTEVFSVSGTPPTVPDSGWADPGSPLLIPNICDGSKSPRIMTIIVAVAPPCFNAVGSLNPCDDDPPGEQNAQIQIAEFATFYVMGCVKLDVDGNIEDPDADGTNDDIDLQCQNNGNSGIVGVFVDAFIPEGGGILLPPEDGGSLSIVLVK